MDGGSVENLVFKGLKSVLKENLTQYNSNFKFIEYWLNHVKTNRERYQKYVNLAN